MQSNQKSPKLWVTSMFLSMVICFNIIALITPDKEFSETENRMLARSPSVTAKSIADGSAEKNIEKYLSDQFAFRDAWSATSSFTKCYLFREKESNGVYIGKDNYLMLIPSESNPEAMEKKLSSVNAVTEKYGNIRHFISIIPNAVTIMNHKLPSHVPGLMKKHQYEELYYHTDHHWTSRGAFLAFTAIAPAMQLNPNNIQYDIYTVSESFEGTLSSKSGSHRYYDKIEIYVPKGEHPVTVKYSDEDETSGTIYQKSFLDTKDKYALFLGGNHPLVTITTTADTDRTLLLIKDSYANCFVQFLTPYFDQIVVVDPRNCYDTVDMIINEYEITDLLYLYNADTFLTDTSLTDLLAFE